MKGFSIYMFNRVYCVGVSDNNRRCDSLLMSSASGDTCSLEISPPRVVVGFGETVTVSCAASRPVRVLGWDSAVGASHTQRDLTVQWQVDSLIDWIEEPICYGVFFTAPRQCEEKLNLVLYSTCNILTSPTNPQIWLLWLFGGFIVPFFFRMLSPLVFMVL